MKKKKQKGLSLWLYFTSMAFMSGLIVAGILATVFVYELPEGVAKITGKQKFKIELILDNLDGIEGIKQ